MPERNTTDERREIIQRATQTSHSLRLRADGLLEGQWIHARAGDFTNAADRIDALLVLLAARPDERAVREREREALSKLAEVAQRKGFRASEVCKNDHRDLADAGDILAFRDREYPALPLPIPPCPLSGGREVRYNGGGEFTVVTGHGRSSWTASRIEVPTLVQEASDLRTLADWLDSLPDAERGKA